MFLHLCRLFSVRAVWIFALNTAHLALLSA